MAATGSSKSASTSLSQARNGRLTPNLPRRNLIAGPRENYLRLGVPLYEASIQFNWKAARAILDEKPELVRYSITENGETPLHVAASAKGDPRDMKEFVKNLVGFMNEEDLALENENFNTALYSAAVSGNVETTKIMVAKNIMLLRIPGARGTMMPLYAAALFGNYEVVKYLYERSRKLSYDDGWSDASRSGLVEKCVENDMFDIALEIVTMYPELRNGTVLRVLASKPEAFHETKSSFVGRIIKLTGYYMLMGHRLSETGLGAVFAFIRPKVEAENKALPLLRVIWEDIVKKPKFEIDRILRGPPDSIKQDKLASERVVRDIQLRKLVNEHLDKLEVETDNIIKGKGVSTAQDITSPPSTTQDPALQLISLISEYLVHMHIASQKIVKQDCAPCVDKLDQDLELQKLISEHILNMHAETQKITKRVSEKEEKLQSLQKLVSKNITKMRAAITLKELHSSRLLFVAAEMGNTRFIVELIRQYPDLIWKVNDNNQSIFHIAVKYRHHAIYNLLYEIGGMKELITPLRDRQENNMLHLAGICAKQKQLENVPGVALQMQRELLWFQEVKSMTPPSYRERKNEDGLTPSELFTMEHKELVTQGERWMKEMANQCMVVAALIATIVFAAAFTIPGGYEQTHGQNYGRPIFHSKETFIVFVVADAISLFSACASIFIFLSILTTRFAEWDFLESIPKKLVLGLVTLFVSITTMTIAFGISFFVLYREGSLWVPILICVFGVFLVLLYAKLQRALFSGVVSSMYASRQLFRHNKPVLYYKNPMV